MPSSKGADQNFIYRPWVVFPPIFISSGLISYAHLGLQADLWLSLFCVILPFCFGIVLSVRSNPSGKPEIPFWETEFLSPLPVWVTGPLILLFVLSRFYRLDSMPFWPLMDEGQYAFFSMKLADKWDGRLLYGNTQVEPLTLWGLALFFKIFKASPHSMRLFSAFFSLATVGAGYWSARFYFSRSLSSILTALLAVHFWTWTFSRQCSEIDLALLWELIVFGILGLYGKAQKTTRWKLEIFFGFILGAGFYIYPACLALVPAIGLVLLFRKGPDRVERTVILLRVFGMMLVVAWPMLTTRLSSGGSAYLSALLSENMAGRYLGSIFFNGFGSAPYGPIWGGLFNAFLGSCLWMGIIEWTRLRKEPLIQWLGLAGFLFFLPGA